MFLKNSWYTVRFTDLGELVNLVEILNIGIDLGSSQFSH
jgi:hypothetical protein